MKNEKIELRSPKVREIIGQIPAFLIRSGISLIFILVIILIVGSKFFSVPYSIAVQVDMLPEDSAYTLKLKVPAQQFDDLKDGQIVSVSLDNISNLQHHKFEFSLQLNPQALEIKNNSGLISFNMQLKKPVYTDNHLILEVHQKQTFSGQINIGNISFFDKIFGVFYKKN
jgi:hypothetical protein